MYTLIFVHGIGDTATSDSDYDRLASNIRKQNNRTTRGKEFQSEMNLLYVNWKEITFPTEKSLMRKTFPKNKVNKLDWSSFLLHFYDATHYFTTIFLGDFIAYASEHESAVRKKFIDTILPTALEGNYSFVAHSLGSVIAFDFLFALYRDDHVEFGGVALTVEQVDRLRKNFSGFYSFGSPIALLLLRKVDLIPNQDSLSKIFNPFLKTTAPWINFYEERDTIAFPVRNVFSSAGPSRFPQDVSVNTGFVPFVNHTGYWRNKKMAQVIARELQKTYNL